MNGPRLHQGLAALGITLPMRQEESLLLFSRELLRWNKKVNLTSISEEDEVIEKHLLDSLTLLPYLKAAENLLDIGSGGGFPALPLKIAMPELEVVSVDAVQKKILFQRHVARLLRLEAFSPVHGRIEELAKSGKIGKGFSVITSRALSDIESFISWAKPFAGPDSLLIAMKGREAERELEESREAIQRQGARLRDVVEIKLPFSGSRRQLLFFSV